MSKAKRKRLSLLRRQKQDRLRNLWGGKRLGTESLEPRLLLAASVSSDAGKLVVTDTTNSNDNIAIQISGGNYVISNNSALTLSGVTGTGSGSNTVTVTTSQFSTNEIVVNASGGDDTITLRNLAGKTATLNGGSGSDTYKFDNNWGAATIADAGGGTLDFSAFTGTLEVHKPSNAVRAHEVIGNGTSTLDYPAGGAFTTNIAGPANVGNLNTGLSAVASLGGRLADVGKLDQGLFLLDGKSIGDVLDVGATLQQKLVDDVGLSGSPTLDQVVSAFGQISGVTATGTRDTASGDVTIDFDLDLQDVIDVELYLGQDVENLLQFDGLRGDLSTAIVWDLQTTVTSTGVFSATAGGNLGITADLNKQNFAARAGFLGLFFASPSTVLLDADVSVASFGTGRRPLN